MVPTRIVILPAINGVVVELDWPAREEQEAWTERRVFQIDWSDESPLNDFEVFLEALLTRDP